MRRTLSLIQNSKSKYTYSLTFIRYVIFTEEITLEKYCIFNTEITLHVKYLKQFDSNIEVYVNKTIKRSGYHKTFTISEFHTSKYAKFKYLFFYNSSAKYFKTFKKITIVLF